MERLCNQYIEKSITFEEMGYVDQALQLLLKCRETFFEQEKEINLEIAKMCYRNGRIEEALGIFLELYEKTEDAEICELILDVFYFERQSVFDKCYQDNCQLLKKYPFFFGDFSLEYHVFPILIEQNYIIYYDSRSECFKRLNRCAIGIKQPENIIVAASDILWLEDILKLEEMTRMTDASMDEENPLFLVYEGDTWELFLQLIDLEQLIEYDRIMLFDRMVYFENALIYENIRLPVKAEGTRLRNNIFELLDIVHIKYQKELNKSRKEALEYYHSNEENILNHIKGAKPKILFMTSRFTTALQYHVRDCKEAADALGCQTRLMIEKDRLCKGFRFLQLLRIVAEFKPDIVFGVDHFKYEEDFLREIDEIVHICWAQDPICDIFNKNTESKLGPRDIIMSHFISWKEFRQVGYDNRRIIDAPIPANHHVYRKYNITSVEQEKYSCDLCFVCHGSDVDGYIKNIMKQYPEEDRQPIYEIYKGYQRYVYETGNLFFGENIFREYIVGALQKYFGIQLSNQVLDFMADDMFYWYSQSVYRQALVDWLLDAGFYNIKLWGNGWVNEPKYAAYAMGPAENGETLSKIYQCSKIVVGNNMRSTAAARAWESMLSGAFYMSNYIPPEKDAVDIRMIMKVDDELVMFYDKQDFLNKVEYYLIHEKERKRMAEIGQKAALERMTYDRLMQRVLQELPQRLELLKGE